MQRILVVGELNADLIMTGLPTLPILGQELVGTGFQVVMGGSSAITAARMSALGAYVDFVGQLGDDDLGRLVLRELDSFGVETQHVQLLPKAHTDVTIVLTYKHDRALLTCSNLMRAFSGAEVTPAFLANYTHLHVGSFFLQAGLQPELTRLFRWAKEAGLTTSLDTGWDFQGQWMQNPHLRPTLAQTDYFFPNETEATALCGGEWSPPELAEMVGGTLIIKRGANGALAVTANGTCDLIHVAAVPVDVVDTTGAGDAFNAGFLYATVVRHATLLDALHFAVACGAQAVTQVGGTTNAPTAEVISTQYLK